MAQEKPILRSLFPILWIAFLISLVPLPGSADPLGKSTKSALRDQRFSPDLVIIEGSSWRKYLSVIPAVSKPDSLPALVFLDESNQEQAENFVTGRRPRKILVLAEKQLESRLVRKLCRGKEKVYISGDHVTISSLLAERQWKESRQAILVSSEDYQAALLASPLAASYRCPLLFLDEETVPRLTIKALTQLKVKEVLIVGKKSERIESQLDSLRPKIIFISEASYLTTLYLKSLAPSTAIDNLIVTNPEDIAEKPLSLLSAPLSLVRHAPILFFQKSPEETEAEVENFERKNNLSLRYLTLIGDEEFLPPRRVPCPLHNDRRDYGGIEVAPTVAEFADFPDHHNDEEYVGTEEIDVEIGSYPVEGKPLSLAVGRISAENIYQGTILLSNITCHQGTKSSGNVLLLSNADGTLDLCEAICRTLVRECKNWRVPTQAYYGKEIDDKLLRKELPDKEVVIVEGHLWDLMKLFEENMVKFSPALFFAQSCHSLDTSYAYPLFRSGAIGYVGSKTAIHSASGAAFSKAFFDAIMYRDMDVGSALLYAKNYLLNWVALKKKRGHSEWAKAYRVALSFALWGDPTTKLQLKRSSRPRLKGMEVRNIDSHFLLITPATWYRTIETEKYYTKFPPGTQFAGVVKKTKEKEKRKLAPLLFADLSMDGLTDFQLETGDLTPADWTHTWDDRTKKLYLLLYPGHLKKGDVFVFTMRK